MSFIVAIDGPAGSGKGTVTSKLAEKFNLMYLDTGAMYRCVTLRFMQDNVGMDDTDKIKKILKDIKIEFKNLTREEAEKYNETAEHKIEIDKNYNPKRVYLDGKDVTKEIREQEVTDNVSQFSQLLDVRLAMSDLQRKACKSTDSILEGRDIGTNVFPNADVKIYLDASVDERVKRRLKQNKENGIDISEKEIRKNIVYRDKTDKERDVAPLKQAEDAIYIDSSNMSINAVVSKISKIIKKKKIEYKREQDAYIMTEKTGWKKFRRACVKNFLGFLYRIVFRVKRNGLENINGNEGIVICANHVNYLDAAGIVLLNKRYIRFVGKHDLFRFWILSKLGHLFNIIPVKRDSSDVASLKLCLKSLKNKEALGIFPEGTRQGLEKNVDIKNGAAFLAYKANVKVVPVGIKGNFKPFTKLEFNFGEPIDVSSFKTDDPDWINNATKHIMDTIIKLSE